MINTSNMAPPTNTPAPNVAAPPVQATTQPVTQAAPPAPTPDANKKNNKYFIIAGIILAVVTIGFLASMLLVEKPQEIRQQAAQCKEECPSPKDGVLRNCTPPEPDGSSEDSICNAKGRVESCGGKKYCCPSPGGTWTTNMTACATPTPEPSPTVEPTPTEEPGLCSSDSVADCRTSDPGDYCNNGDGECTTDGTNGADNKEICTCLAPQPTATGTPAVTPTTEPTTEPTSVPTTEPTARPTDPAATEAPTSAPTTAPTTSAQATTAPTQPPLPSQLPETGPADWLKNLSIGLGALGVGALLFLFL